MSIKHMWSRSFVAASKSKQFLRFHTLGIILSFAIGVIISTPPFVWHFSQGFRGVEMMKTNTETHYLGQVQELYDGHYGLGNPYLAADLKNQPYLFPPLGTYLTFALGKLFFLNAVHVVMVLRFIFTSLLAWLVYFFSYQVTKRRDAALVAAPFVVVAYSLVDPARILGVLSGHGLSIEKTFIDYGRPVTPQISSLFFFAYLVFFWNSLYGNSVRWRRSIIAAVITLGLSFYVYLFTWTFIFSLNGFLLLVYVWQKDWQKVRQICLISVSAGLIGAPYLLHAWQVAHHPWYTEVAPRFGFVKSHTPNISRLVLIALATFLLTYRKLARDMRLFFLAFFATAIFVVNEQVITGQYIFNHHYHWYYNTPLVIIALVALMYAVLPRFLKAAWGIRLVTGLFVIIFLGYGVAVQTVSYHEALPQVVAEQRYAPLIAWLNHGAPKDSTVFAPLPFAHMIPAVTQQNVYYTSNALYSMVPNERLAHAYLVYTYLDGVPKERIREYLESHRADISGFVYGYTYYFQSNVCTSCFPDTVIDRMADLYKKISADNFIDFVKQYPIDYLVWDKTNNPAWRLERWRLPVAAKFDDIIVFSAPR